MSSSYTIRMYNARGEFLYFLKPMSLELSRKRGDTGSLVMYLDPSIYDIQRLNQPDARIFVERKVEGHAGYIEGKTVWLVRRATITGGINKPLSIKLTAQDANCLLNRRIIAYYPEEPETEKELPILDIILEILHENLGADAVAARDLSVYLSIPAANTNYGPTKLVNIAWRDVGGTIRELIEAAKEEGYIINLDIQLQSIEPLKMLVVVGRSVGSDMTVEGTSLPNSRLLIGPDYGNFDDWELDYDHTSEITYLYAGGEGEDDDRLIVEVSNATTLRMSPFGRIEGWVERQELDVTAELETWAKGQLGKKITHPKLTGKIIEDDQMQWGVNLNFGNLVPIQALGIVFDCVIDSYQLKHTPDGGDNLIIGVESL